MRPAPHIFSFLRRILAPRAVRQEDDPAGMGTAFGLEASLAPTGKLPAEDQAWPAAGPERIDPSIDWLGHRR